jgi:hypothetical protein
MSTVRTAWPEIEIDESQAVVIAPDDSDMDAIVDRIMIGLHDLPNLDEADDQMRIWVGDVAGLLEKAKAPYMTRVAHTLGLNKYELAVGRSNWTIGAALLHAQLGQAERALWVVFPGMRSDAMDLAYLIDPIGFPVEFAEPLLRAMNRPYGQRIAVVGARRPETGPRMVARASCCDALTTVLDIPLEIGFEKTDEEVHKSLRHKVAKFVGVKPDELEPDDITELPGPLVVTLQHLGDQGVTLDVLRLVIERFMREFPMVTIVVLTAKADVRSVAVDLGHRNAVIIPPLTAGQEKRSHAFAERLYNHARGRWDR